MTFPFIWTLKSHYRDINWPNFNIVVSIGKPKERQRDDEGMAGRWRSQNTQTLWDKFTILYGYGS